MRMIVKNHNHHNNLLNPNHKKNQLLFHFEKVQVDQQ